MDLETFTKEEWAKIPTEVCKNLISNYQNRLEVVIANKGYATGYQSWGMNNYGHA